jgi:prepilin-type N-terminal cleavage/methylation domain-containing protein
VRHRTAAAPEDGFTLPELLVAITILGIIIVAIGAMISTAFRTSTTVSAELQGSRGPKVVSRYWVPDVEQADTVSSGLDGCPGAGTPFVTMTSRVFPSAFDPGADPRDQAGQIRTITWREVRVGQRDQLVRWVCEPGAQPKSFIVVSDLTKPPGVTADSDHRFTITVTVPDRSRTNDEYEFDVTGQSQITTTSTT